MGVTQDDIEFLEAFMADELTEENMQELDRRLQNPEFKKYYNQKLDEKYDQPPIKTLIDYMPMIIMIVLIVIGVFLFIRSN